MKPLYDLRLSVLAEAYREGQIAPREVITALRERALALNPSFNAFIYLLTPEELEPYLAALEGVAPDTLPLFGVPFAIKDNIDLAGIDTTAACPAFAYRAEQDATIVSQLIALGAIPLGKTNLDQFATGLNGTRSPYGPCRNSVHPITRPVAPARVVAGGRPGSGELRAGNGHGRQRARTGLAE